MNGLELAVPVVLAMAVATACSATRRRRRRRRVVMMARPATSYERWVQRHPGGWWRD